MAINIKELTKGKSMKMSQSEVERVVKEYVEKIEKENGEPKMKEVADTILEIVEILENKIKVLEGKVTLLENQQKEEFLDKFAYKTDIAYLDSKINLKSDKGSFINFTDGGIVTLVKDENLESKITQTKGKITIYIKDNKSGTMARFIGKDGSMGFENGRKYYYTLKNKCGYIWVTAHGVSIPYSGMKELLENWDVNDFHFVEDILKQN